MYCALSLARPELLHLFRACLLELHPIPCMPPGTGKSRTVAALLHLVAQVDLRVLFCAGSNVAVDNVMERLVQMGLSCVRLGESAAVVPKLRQYTVDQLVAPTQLGRQIEAMQAKLRCAPTCPDPGHGPSPALRKILAALKYSESRG